MRRSVILSLVCALLPLAASADALDRGLAITDPVLLRALDHGEAVIDLGVGRVLTGRAGLLRNDALFARPGLAPVIRELNVAIDGYIAAQRDVVPDARIGVGEPSDIRLFDRAALTSAQTRFALAGIVNRMDRAYVAPESCGEVRLIYRLTREGGETGAASRLPMTMSAVLRAGSRGEGTSSCADPARRWQAVTDGGDVAPLLSMLDPADLDRIEFNLQIAYVPQSSERAFRTDYLMMVFRRDAGGVFAPSPMENQIDRARLAADPALKAEFDAWLLAHLADLDRGTILIPDRFLANEAIASTPAPVIADSEAVAALTRADREGIALQNIRSPAGFARRLDDITCTGCHETRGIGAFHFPGVDAAAGSAGVHGSPFFFGDQPRRRDIVRAMAQGRAPDFSRGFSDRPQRRGGGDLRGTSYDDGWGATCYRPHADAAQDDPSFRDWTCAQGLVCQPAPNADAASRIGMCFVGER